MTYRNNLKNRKFGKAAETREGPGDLRSAEQVSDSEPARRAPQNFDSERATIAERLRTLAQERECALVQGKQVSESELGPKGGASETQNNEAKPTPPKADSSGYFGIGQEIVQEIDNTLDQLIRNAEMISGADLDELTEVEMEAFQKTQESLVHHLLHMDQCLASKQLISKIDARSATQRIQAKRIQFDHMKSQYSPRLEAKKPRQSFLSKRRKKRFFAELLQPRKNS